MLKVQGRKNESPGKLREKGIDGPGGVPRSFGPTVKLLDRQGEGRIGFGWATREMRRKEREH